MKRARAWTSLWAPRLVQPTDVADKMVIREPMGIRRLVGDLTRSGRLLSLQTPDGVVARSGTLQVDAAGHLHLILQPDQDGFFDASPVVVNVTASAETGLLLLTLACFTQQAPGRLRCDWPHQLIQVQSRRHFRVKVLAGTKHRATLALPGVERAVRLQDLSEEGVGFLLDGAGVPLGTRYARATLTLGRESITVPCVQVVHSRERAGEVHGAVGAQLMDLAAADTRRLRRWIAMVQAEMVWSVPLAHT
jgi:hypothetical protein